MTNFLKEAYLCISAIEINYSPILPQSLQAQSRQPNFNLNPQFLLEPLKKKKKNQNFLYLLELRKISQFLKIHTGDHNEGEKNRDITTHIQVSDLTV